MRNTVCGTDTVAPVHITVYAWVDFVGQVGVVRPGGGVDASATGVVVAVAKASLAGVEINLSRVLHQVSVVRSWGTIVCLVGSCVAALEGATA